MAAYSFMDVTASFVGPGVVFDVGSGSAHSDEGITVAMAGNKNTMTLGIDGEGMNSLLPGKSGTITINLLQTSPVNKKLSLAYNAQSESSATWGNNVIVIRNNASGDVITARGVAFNKLPDMKFTKEGGTLSWVFDCIKIDQVMGVY
ncbi:MULTISPECIES: phage structural protein [unclassified Erwinia]|uniref:phage structural protein n=1 Tax=Erwinia TaxID=551 RepID=UPI000833AA1A|nr:phage protein [Erwinia sp. ErVv1]